MMLLLALLTMVFIYLATFKEDFEDSDFEKSIPFVVLIAIVLFIGGFVISLV